MNPRVRQIQMSASTDNTLKVQQRVRALSTAVICNHAGEIARILAQPEALPCNHVLVVVDLAIRRLPHISDDIIVGLFRYAILRQHLPPASFPNMGMVIDADTFDMAQTDNGRLLPAQLIVQLVRKQSSVDLMDRCLAQASYGRASLTAALKACCGSGSAEMTAHLIGRGANRPPISDALRTALLFERTEIADLLMADGARVSHHDDYRTWTDSQFAQVFMRSPLMSLYTLPPRDWYTRHAASAEEWCRQHHLRNEIERVATAVAALETLADADADADGVVEQSLDTCFSLVVLREMVLRQLREVLRESHCRVPGLGSCSTSLPQSGR